MAHRQRDESSTKKKTGAVSADLGFFPCHNTRHKPFPAIVAATTPSSSVWHHTAAAALLSLLYNLFGLSLSLSFSYSFEDSKMDEQDRKWLFVLSFVKARDPLSMIPGGGGGITWTRLFVGREGKHPITTTKEDDVRSARLSYER